MWLLVNRTIKRVKERGADLVAMMVPNVLTLELLELELVRSRRVIIESSSREDPSRLGSPVITSWQNQLMLLEP